MKSPVEFLNIIAAELNITDKNACIGIAIKMLVDAGKTVQEATDIIMGAGSYRAISDSVYESLAA